MNECNIVRDLMPIMADGLASEDTAEFVHRHLEGCEACRTAWERYNGELPALEPPQTEKKTLKSLLRSMIWMVLKGILILTAGLCVFMGLVYYYFWENEYLPIQKSFPSTDEKYRVDMVDWDTSGFWDTGEGSIMYFRNGSGYMSTHFPWDDLDVVWAPDGANAMLMIETVTGKLEYRVLENKYGEDEDGRHNWHTQKIIPRYGKADLQFLLAKACKAYEKFPTGWEKITFTFTQWESDSETVIFHYETDTGESGFLSYHFPTETITKLYQ